MEALWKQWPPQRVINVPPGTEVRVDGDPPRRSGTGSKQRTRWHLPDGRATRTIVNLSYPEDRLSLSPTGEGPSVVLRGHWNRHYTYPIPGDRSARVLTEVGAVYVVTTPGEGLVFHDLGLIRYQPGADFEEVDILRGPHPLWTDAEAVERAVCGLLT